MNLRILKSTALTGAILLSAVIGSGGAATMPGNSGALMEQGNVYEQETAHRLKELRNKLGNVMTDLEAQHKREQEQLEEIQNELDALLGGEGNAVYCPARIRWAVGKC